MSLGAPSSLWSARGRSDIGTSDSSQQLFHGRSFLAVNHSVEDTPGTDEEGGGWQPPRRIPSCNTMDLRSTKVDENSRQAARPVWLDRFVASFRPCPTSDVSSERKTPGSHSVNIHFTVVCRHVET